jgi:hypothetical protein
MRYLGGIVGVGVLKCEGKDIARASYDLDGFFDRLAGMKSSGEIRSSPAALKDVFGRKNVQLLTDEGQLLNLSFSEKALPPGSPVAHVDVMGTVLNIQRGRPH